MRKIQMDCLPELSGRLAHLQSSNILTTKMKSLLAELNMRYFNSANRFHCVYLVSNNKKLPHNALDTRHKMWFRV